MDAPIGSTTWVPARTPAGSPSTMPAKSAKPVAGPLGGPPVVIEPPVAKDGLKPQDSPRGPLVPASALQPWQDTDDAIKGLLKAEQAFKQQTLAESGDFVAAAKLVGDASQKLVAAVRYEMAALAGNIEMGALAKPNAGAAELKSARDHFVTSHALSPDLQDDVHRILGEAFKVIAKRNWPSAVEGLEVLDREPKVADRGQYAPRPDPLAKAIEKFPNLRKLDADFGRAYEQLYELHHVNPLTYGRPVVRGYIQQLQKAAAERCAGWSEAYSKVKQGNDPELKDPELEEGCQLGLDEARRGIGLVNEPATIEMQENLLYARGVVASRAYERAVESGGDHVAPGSAARAVAVVLGSAARLAWEAAEQDPATRNNPRYLAVCRANLQRFSEFQESHADPEHVKPIDDLPPAP
jgi:hypothetical protein